MKMKPFRLVIFHQSHQKKAQNPPPSAELPPIQNSILAVVVDGRHLEAIGGKIYKFFLFILINHYLNCFFSGFLKDQQ